MEKMNTRSLGKDLSVGSIPRHLLDLAMPMLVGNLINTGYSVVNTIWLGKIVGENAVGASAVSWPVIFILIGFASGATIATTILVSQNYGAKDFAMVRRVVDTSYAIALLFGGLLTIAGILGGDFILHSMNTPADIFPLASPYFRISMLGFVFQFLAFLLTSILRGMGDTKTPLFFMAGGVLLNAILDPLLIIGIGPFPRLGLNGAAVASVISSFAALFAGILYINKKSELMAFGFSRLRLDKDIIIKIITLGFPSTIQQTLVSMSSVFVTTFVNAFGPQAIAAFGAAGRLDSIIFMPAMSLMMATTALAGQNLGAGKPERIHAVFIWGLRFTLFISCTLIVILVSFPSQILLLFLNDPSVIAIGASYLRIVCPSYVFMAILFICNGIINGAGKTFITMFFTLLSLWIFRVPLAAWLSHTSLGITGIWIAIDVGIVAATIVSLGYYFSGNWKKGQRIKPPEAIIPSLVNQPVIND
jgi:putative MATE family efflux protein